jgi:hypothetical protein
VSAAAFLVSWLVTDRLQVSRSWYVGVLFVVTGALSAGYLAWLGVGAGEVLTARWGWGLVGAVVAGALPALGMTRLAASQRHTGSSLGTALAWEGAVYGVAEGVLLSALPAFVTWQLIHSLGWAGPAGAVARWTLPVLASAFVIVVHHLGYPEYRNRQLIPVTVACGLLTVGYLITASVLAPALGHVLMHAAAIGHGTELPPHRGGAGIPADRPDRALARL